MLNDGRRQRQPSLEVTQQRLCEARILLYRFVGLSGPGLIQRPDAEANLRAEVAAWLLDEDSP
jgi:hypothetical protein